MSPITHTLCALTLTLLAAALIPAGRWDVAGVLIALAIVHLCHTTEEQP
ncbi:hypothetical protein QEP66_01010 [Streptomyces sp. LB8]|nr:hypothetical protein [Streptomyces sp. LB8]MDN5380710.1 hypothetical protein [Streptomyces sp. LB8]